MSYWSRAALAASLVTAFATVFASAPPGIELVATGYIPGNLLDKSGLAGVICQAGNPANCVPKAAWAEVTNRQVGGRDPASGVEAIAWREVTNRQPAGRQAT